MKYQIVDFLKQALSEDIGRGDLARRLVNKNATAFIRAKSEGIVAGLEYVKHFSEIADVKFGFNFEDGEQYKNGDVILNIYGNAKDILSIERTMLNILQHASGIASNAREFISAAEGKIKILDTRKTRPGLRIFEKYAAFCGGVTNHRLGLDDCLMLKDTHLALFNSMEKAVKNARKNIPFTAKIEIEAETVETAFKAMEAGADIVMCDNMSFDDIKKVVEHRNRHYQNVLIEASGNVTLENIKNYIETGIDALSSGAIIHQATFKDFSMKMKG
jgi:nicotinate-nucleotide pyrophosphorylase (carboxylating)